MPDIEKVSEGVGPAHESLDMDDPGRIMGVHQINRLPRSGESGLDLKGLHYADPMGNRNLTAAVEE